MKQNITVEQLNELSEKGKEKLKAWWYKNNKDHTLIVSRSDTTHLRENGTKVYVDIHGWELPRLSVGQMIEFLDENINLRFSSFYKELYRDDDEEWHWWLDIDDKKLLDSIHKPELCDALWEAVKEILNR